MKTQVDIKPRLFTIPQSVAYSNDSRATLYKEHKHGNLKFVKMGTSTRIERDELDRYIDEKASRAS